jgi:hemerythrin-like domain-containing protein
MRVKPVARHLIEDHRAVLAALEDLEGALEPLDLPRIRRDASLLADLLPRHRRKEETVVFPALAGKEFFHRTALETASREHGLEETYLEEVLAFLRVATEDERYAGPLVEACRSMILFFRDHLWKEEHFVFPCIDRFFPACEQEEMVRRMDALEVPV